MDKNKNKCASCDKWLNIPKVYEIDGKSIIMSEGECTKDDTEIRYGYYGDSLEEICDND